VKGNHRKLEKRILKSWQTKQPLFIWGAVGIGKSETVREMAKKIAEDLNREFIEWNDATTEQKEDVLREPEKYFILIDKRLLQSDGTDIIGTPSQQKQCTKWLPDEFVYIMSLEGTAGILFFDEFNLAPTIVQNVSQQLLLDRAVGSTSIGDQWLVICAGNRLEDRVFVHEMSSSVANRLRHFELQPPAIDDWVQWATEHGLDGRVVAFNKWKEGSYLYKFNPDSEEKAWPSPRSWRFVSDDILGETDLETVRDFTADSVGMGVAMEFQAFVKLQQELPSVSEVLDGTVNIPEDISINYSLIGAITEYYRQHKSKDTLRKIVKLCADDRIQAEFQILLLRMVKGVDRASFGRYIMQIPEWRPPFSERVEELIRE
jgi:MoxR-like ATPase